MSISDSDERPSRLPLHRYCVLDGPDARVRLAAMSTIVAILIHEVSQPISAATNYIQCCANRLRNHKGAGDSLLPMIEQAGSEAVKAGEIIRRMRSFIVSGTIGGRPESLSEMIASASAELMCPDGMEAEIQTEVDAGADKVLVDRTLIEQVLAILFENACEAMIGRTHRRIAISIARRGGNVVMRMQDSGPGMSDYQFVHVFEPLFTTMAAGSGLGLPICKTIVEAHGGRLWAEAPGEGGATFGLSLPAVG